MAVDTSLTLALIDSNTLFRQGVSRILQSCADFVTPVEFASLEEAARTLESTGKADVILADGDLFSETPAESFSALRASAPHAKIIILTSEGTPQLLTFMLRAGAEAYVYKDSTSEELIGTIRSAGSRNDHVIISVSRADSRRLYEDSGLSIREREILAMVAKGYSNNEISRRLYITVGTVKRHLTNIYAKLQTRSRTEAVNKSLEMGVLSLDQIVSSRDSVPNYRT